MASGKLSRVQPKVLSGRVYYISDSYRQINPDAKINFYAKTGTGRLR
jgi:hypothetical protein